jgi:ABC-type glycerol-3-phosphate transport system permease component
MKTSKTLRIYQPDETILLTRPARRLRPGTILLHATLIFFCLIILVPIAWVFMLSVKSIRDAYHPSLWPEHFDFSHYGFVFSHFPDLSRNLANTLVVTLSTVVLTTTCAVLAGYALAHLRLPGRTLVVSVMVATLFFPTRLLSLIAILDMHSKLHLLNTLIGLTLPYVALNLVVSVLIMRGIFSQISPEIVDAARIDGSSSWHILRAILLPLAKNGIVVVVITAFVTAWGEYLLAITLNTDQDAWTMLEVLVHGLGGMGVFELPQVAATYLLFITPGLLAFVILQRWFMKGLIEGALSA